MQSLLGNTRKPDIVFSQNGRINISARVAKHLALQHGDVIDIMCDDNEHYLYVKHHAPTIGRHQAMVFRTNPRGNHYRASSKKLCHYIMQQANTHTNHIKLSCGEPVDLSHYGPAIPIIIKHQL